MHEFDQCIELDMALNCTAHDYLCTTRHLSIRLLKDLPCIFLSPFSLGVAIVAKRREIGARI